MDWVEPLNLKYLLINILSGSTEFFTLISFIAIAGLAAYFRMTSAVSMLLFMLFAVIMSAYMSGVYFLVLLIVGIIIAFSVGRIVKH